jgi:hypothetical protein
MGAAVDGCGGGWVRRWMDGNGVMDRDTHIDRQWVCGVYSQLEWFSNAHNAPSLRWLLSQAVHRAYMSLPRFPLSVHRNLRLPRFPLSLHRNLRSARLPLPLHRTLRSARFPLRRNRARVPTAFPRTGAFAYACWEQNKRDAV